jgi:hypothetical protein
MTCHSLFPSCDSEVRRTGWLLNATLTVIRGEETQ